MGLDASVMCPCFARGLTTEPPVPRDWLEVDEEGYLNVKPECEDGKAWAKVYGWKQTCCEHPEMCYAWEPIANWGGYRLFQEALGRVGWERFPVLRAELPNTNDGKTEADRSALALAELGAFRAAGAIGSNVGWERFPVLRAELPNTNDGKTEADRSALALAELGAFRAAGAIGSNVGWERFPVLRAELPNTNDGKTEADRSALALAELGAFRAAGAIGSNVCLVDSTTGETLYEHVASYGGVFTLDGRARVDLGFDEAGFFVRERDGGAELFRAIRFRQTLLDPDREPYGPEPGRVAFLDLDSGRTFECRTAVSGHEIPWPDGRMQDDRGKVRLDHPPELHVESRPERASDYEYAAEPLAKVFRASVATGNPVRWC